MARSLPWAAALVLSCSAAAAQKVNAAITNLSDASPAGATDGISRLGVDEIVQRLADGEKKRAEDLKGYTEQRSYSVSYSGFPVSLSATIVVEATYDAPANKQFQVLSQ